MSGTLLPTGKEAGYLRVAEHNPLVFSNHDPVFEIHRKYFPRGVKTQFYDTRETLLSLLKDMFIVDLRGGDKWKLGEPINLEAVTQMENDAIIQELMNYQALLRNYKSPEYQSPAAQDSGVGCAAIDSGALPNNPDGLAIAGPNGQKATPGTSAGHLLVDASQCGEGQGEIQARDANMPVVAQLSRNNAIVAHFLRLHTSVALVLRGYRDETIATYLNYLSLEMFINDFVNNFSVDPGLFREAMINPHGHASLRVSWGKNILQDCHLRARS